MPVPGKPTKPFKIGSFVLATKSKARIVRLTCLYPHDFTLAATSGEGPKIVNNEPGLAAEGEAPEQLMARVEKFGMTPKLDHLDSPRADKERD
mgnify:CR=1 FL=1